MRASRAAAAWLLAIAIAAVPSVSLAQQGKWFAPYKKGVDAYNDKKWAEAITNLTAAIAIDGVDAMNKCCAESNAFENYMPHLYLAGAYAALGNHAKAREALRQFGTPKNLSRAFTTQRSQIEAALPPEPAPNPPPRPTSNPPPPPPTDPFQTDGPLANTLLNEKKLAEAITVLERMRNANAIEFTSRGFAPKLESARNDLGRARSLVGEGDQALQQKQVNTARQKYTEANGIAAGLGTSGIDKCDALDKEFNDALAAARAAARAGNKPKAIADFATAKDKNVQRYNSMNLDDEVKPLTAVAPPPPPPPPPPTPSVDPKIQQSKDAVTEGLKQIQGKNYLQAESWFQRAVDLDPNNKDAADRLANSQRYTGLKSAAQTLLRQPSKRRSALNPLRDAQATDGVRFQVDGLDRELKKLEDEINILPPPTNQMVPTILQGLSAYVEGDVEKAISLLSPLAQNPQGLEKDLAANVYGYLGAAYGTRSILSVTESDRESNRQRAIDQFRAALKAVPEFTLSQRWVSPMVQNIFQEAKRR